MEDALVQGELQLAHGLAQPYFLFVGYRSAHFLILAYHFNNWKPHFNRLRQRKKVAFGHSK